MVIFGMGRKTGKNRKKHRKNYYAPYRDVYWVSKRCSPFLVHYLRCCLLIFSWCWFLYPWISTSSSCFPLLPFERDLAKKGKRANEGMRSLVVAVVVGVLALAGGVQAFEDGPDHLWEAPADDKHKWLSHITKISHQQFHHDERHAQCHGDFDYAHSKVQGACVDGERYSCRDGAYCQIHNSHCNPNGDAATAAENRVSTADGAKQEHNGGSETVPHTHHNVRQTRLCDRCIAKQVLTKCDTGKPMLLECEDDYCKEGCVEKPAPASGCDSETKESFSYEQCLVVVLELFHHGGNECDRNTRFTAIEHPAGESTCDHGARWVCIAEPGFSQADVEKEEQEMHRRSEEHVARMTKEQEQNAEAAEAPSV